MKVSWSHRTLPQPPSQTHSTLRMTKTTQANTTVLLVVVKHKVERAVCRTPGGLLAQAARHRRPGAVLGDSDLLRTMSKGGATASAGERGTPTCLYIIGPPTPVWWVESLHE